jgi:uncharacterized BrkB/YihY/UPF0761 family membrane protein
VTFGLAYRLIPSASTTLRSIWPGILVGAVGFEGAKHLFALYLENFGRYDIVYGSIGAIVAFLVFVYIGANVLLLGAQVASEWPDVRDRSVRERDREDPPRPGRTRGARAPRRGCGLDERRDFAPSSRQLTE